MPENMFWSYFPSDNTDDGFVGTNPDEALEALVAAVPNAKEWRYRDMHTRRDLPLYQLILAINYLDFDETIRKFLPAQRVLPENITLIMDPDRFREILYTQPRRGSVTFQWNSLNTVEDGATQVPPKSRVVKSLYRKVGWDQDKDEYYCPEELTVAVCILEGSKLEVYAAPRDWNQVVEQVMNDLRRMTVREKADKEVESALRGFVNLLGKDRVFEVLNGL